MEKIKFNLLVLVIVLSNNFGFAQNTTTKIGANEWMVQNLKVTQFSNGDLIPQAQSRDEWEKAGDKEQPAWCYVEGKGADETQEILYNWYAVNDSRGLAPKGFRVATQEDWTDLSDSLGGAEIAGEKLREGKFQATPCGWRKGYGAEFASGGYGAHWWANTEINGSGRTYTVQFHQPALFSAAGSKGYGRSVRCVKQ